MKCKYCGCEFEQNKRGRKKEYCSKADCIRKARNDAQKKWYANSMQKKLAGTKHRIVEKVDKPVVVYSSTDRVEHKLNMPDFSDIVEVARNIGANRYQLIQMVQKENAELSKYDKADQNFLHKLENLDELTDQEAIDLVIEEKKSREGRRNNKVRRQLIQGLLNGIPMKNPSAFVAQAIQRSKNFKYIPRVIEELKQDENLYAVKEESL